VEEGVSVGGPKDGTRVRHELHVRPLAGPAIFRTSQLSLKFDCGRITFHYFTCVLIIIIVIIIIIIAVLGSDTDCSTNNETPRVTEICRLGRVVPKFWAFSYILIHFYFCGCLFSD